MTGDLNSKRPRYGTRWRPSVRCSGLALTSGTLPAVNKVKHLLCRSGWCKIEWKRSLVDWKEWKTVSFSLLCAIPHWGVLPLGRFYSALPHTLPQPCDFTVRRRMKDRARGVSVRARVHKMCNALRHFNHSLLLLWRRLSRRSYQLPLDS